MRVNLVTNSDSSRKEKIKRTREKARSIAAIIKHENSVTISKQARDQICTIIHDGKPNKSMRPIIVSNDL